MSEPTDLYRYYDANDVLLYVGISKSAIARAIQHEARSGWWEHYARMTREVFPTREAALEAERAAIIAERPLHNVIHNDAERRCSVEQIAPRTLDGDIFFICDAGPETGHYQGRLLGASHLGYNVELFSWVSGEANGEKFIPFDAATRWVFFRDHAEFLESAAQVFEATLAARRSQ